MSTKSTFVEQYISKVIRFNLYKPETISYLVQFSQGKRFPTAVSFSACTLDLARELRDKHLKKLNIQLKPLTIKSNNMSNQSIVITAIEKEIKQYEKEIKQRQDHIDGLNKMLATYQKNGTAVSIVLKKKTSSQALDKMGSIKWEDIITPIFNENGNTPMTIREIVDKAFEGRHASTKNRLVQRAQASLYLYKQQGLVKSEGEKGTAGNCNMKFSLVK